MFKELKGLSVVVKQLSNELRKVVRSWGHQALVFVTIQFSLFPLLSFSTEPLVALMASAGQVPNETHVNIQICLAERCIRTASLESSYVLITMSLCDAFVLEPWQTESFHSLPTIITPFYLFFSPSLRIAFL